MGDYILVAQFERLNFNLKNRNTNLNTIEAKQNLKLLKSDLKKLQELNHLNSTYQFKRDCNERIASLVTYIRNIERGLKAHG